MAVKLFGFTFGSDDDKKPKTVIAPESDDGSLTVSSGYGFGNYGYYLDLEEWQSCPKSSKPSMIL